MSAFVAVDLSRLPAPNVVEPLDFETIFSEMLAKLRELDPQFTTLSEADPAYKVLQVAAFRELNIRQRVNDAARATMLAYATGSDLDQIVAREPYNIERLLISPGDPDAIPPVEPTWESDEDLRRRAQLAPERYNTAGPEGAYIFHALSAHPDVLDASCISPEPGQVVVTVLSRTGNGVPSEEVLAAVEAKLSHKDVRPLTDELIVQAATVVEYAIEGDLTLYEGPDEDLVKAEAEKRAQELATRLHRLGMDVELSAVDGALHCEGVKKVSRTAPAAPVVVDKTQASFCTAVTVNVVGRDE